MEEKNLKNEKCACGHGHHEHGHHEHGHGDHEHGHHEHEHGGHEHGHHEHGHCHACEDHEDRKAAVTRIIIAGILFVLLLILDHVISPAFMENRLVNTVCYLIPWIIVGRDVIKGAFTGLFHGDLLGEEFLMVLASAGAFATGENAEGAAVLILYSVGEFCQDLAVDRSRRSIRDLMDLTPAYANVEGPDGALKQISPEELHIGDRFVVLAGERIPVDGTVLSGESLIDTSSMTGEPVPKKAAAGSEVISGCINGEERLVIRADKEYKNSAAAKVMELTEHAADRKSKTENFITRFSHIYTPVVVGLAVLLAAVPPLVTGSPFPVWIRRACSFLVISCPCALVISVPLGFFGGIGAAGRNGILVKGSNYLEALTHVKVLASDKTGTLTKGEFKIVKAVLPDGRTVELDPDHPDAVPEGCSADVLRQIRKLITAAALAERDSTHPIARSIREAYALYNKAVFNGIGSCNGDVSCGMDLRSRDVSCGMQQTPSLPHGKDGQSRSIPGQGMYTVSEDGTERLAGSRALLTGHQVGCPILLENGTLVYVAENKSYLGTLIISDRIKPEAEEAVRQLRRQGVEKIVLLTGDTPDAALFVKETLGLDDVRAGLLPQHKAKALEEMLKTMNTGRTPRKEKLLYAGDGMNDAPVLALADIGAAMGSLGSDAAIEAADVVIMDDDIRRIPLAMDIARKTVAICRQNIVFALTVKILFLLLGAFGIAGMWMAVFADVGVALLCILNSMRMIRYPSH